LFSEEDSEDDEDDTAELLRELEKIKRERAEEKARIERDQSASEAASREAEVATGNPLLNLAAALGQQTPAGVNTTVPGTFQVKKRWDDGTWKHFRRLNSVSLTDGRLFVLPDVIFKNQAMNQKTPGQGSFVNDLLRTEFHRFVDTFSMYSQVLTDKPYRKFMAKFIKVCSNLHPYVLTFFMPFVISESLYYRYPIMYLSYSTHNKRT
jgi:hypothetical protein